MHYCLGHVREAVVRRAENALLAAFEFIVKVVELVMPVTIAALDNVAAAPVPKYTDPVKVFVRTKTAPTNNALVDAHVSMLDPAVVSTEVKFEKVVVNEGSC